jgi:hypothetical protein
MAVALRVDLGDRVVDGAVKAIRAGRGLGGQMMPLQVAPDAKVSCKGIDLICQTGVKWRASIRNLADCLGRLAEFGAGWRLKG